MLSEVLCIAALVSFSIGFEFTLDPKLRNEKESKRQWGIDDYAY